MSKRHTRSYLQEINTFKKKVKAIDRNEIPSYTDIMHMRNIQLALEFLTINANPEKAIVTQKAFAKSKNMGTATLRKAIKEITHSGMRKVNPKSNNIQKYQNDKKELLQKTREYGEQALTQEERLRLQKIQEKELQRIEKCKKRAKAKHTDNEYEVRGGYREHENDYEEQEENTIKHRNINRALQTLINSKNEKEQLRQKLTIED